MPEPAGRGWLLAAALAQTACAALASVDPWEADGAGVEGGGAPAGSSASAGESQGAGASASGCALAPDCASDACVAEGFACAPIPPGWNGPVALYDGPAAGAPDCSGVFDQEVFPGIGSDPVAEALVCGACVCDAGSVMCPLEPLEFSAEMDCSNTASVVQGTNCNSTGNPMAKAYRAAPPIVFGTCTPQGDAVLAAPPPAWNSVAVACGAEPAVIGCGAGEVCAPGAPGGLALCVWVAGDAACPEGYPVAHREHEQFIDTRTCEPCACDLAECQATTTLYSEPNCTGPATAIPNTDTCVAPGTGFMSRQASVTAGCPPSGGRPKGLVAAGPVAVTFCCSE